jgi:hypothetical protein
MKTVLDLESVFVDEVSGQLVCYMRTQGLFKQEMCDW